MLFWDTYKPNSLTMEECINRADGQRRKVVLIFLHKMWNIILYNKSQCMSFLPIVHLTLSCVMPSMSHLPLSCTEPYKRYLTLSCTGPSKSYLTPHVLHWAIYINLYVFSLRLYLGMAGTTHPYHSLAMHLSGEWKVLDGWMTMCNLSWPRTKGCQFPPMEPFIYRCIIIISNRWTPATKIYPKWTFFLAGDSSCIETMQWNSG